MRDKKERYTFLSQEIIKESHQGQTSDWAVKSTARCCQYICLTGSFSSQYLSISQIIMGFLSGKGMVFSYNTVPDRADQIKVTKQVFIVF